MPSDALRPLIAQLRQIGEADGLSDAQLLERYVGAGDGAAFELLVWRHGGLVLGVARRVLGHGADADDAFQAAFLTLARKAATIRRADGLAAWLHRVTSRIALRQRQRRAHRWSVERPLGGVDLAREPPAADDLGPVLDAEVARLPEKYRRVVILCYLQGGTVADAARALGVPRGTVLSRLSTARTLLRRRLVRRGIAPAALGVLAAGSADAAPTAALVSAAARLGGLPSDIPSQVAQMSNGVIQAMFWKKCRIVLVLLAVAAVGGVGVGRADKPAAGGGDEPAPAQQAAQKPKPAQPGADWIPPRPLETGKLSIDFRKGIEQMDEKFAAERSEMRMQSITVEEKLREADFRQAWQREQQRRAIQNLDTTLHDLVARKKTAESELQNIRAELEHAAQVAQKAATDRKELDARVNLLRSTYENGAKQIKRLEDEITTLRHQVQKHTDEAAAAEESRTAERVRLRQELASVEDRSRALDRTQARQREEIMARLAEVAGQHYRTPPEPAQPDRRERDLERKLDEMQRELTELRRELKRSTKPE